MIDVAVSFLYIFTGAQKSFYIEMRRTTLQQFFCEFKMEFLIKYVLFHAEFRLQAAGRNIKELKFSIMATITQAYVMTLGSFAPEKFPPVSETSNLTPSRIKKTLVCHLFSSKSERRVL